MSEDNAIPTPDPAPEELAELLDLAIFEDISPIETFGSDGVDRTVEFVREYTKGPKTGIPPRASKNYGKSHYRLKGTHKPVTKVGETFELIDDTGVKIVLTP